MATMESPSAYPESPMDQEDVVYPCKGCGEILEEGKAFELAGNRWHIDCFRCNTCGTLLDSDANLLLLGDGSLICNNCTYSCSACNNKIEDLAILTGDQAFCSGCFRCRNCKRKIENLRYARTSQGIFCMSCHESLMARRRKKARTPKQAAAGAQPGHDKALPSLPPGVAPQSAFTPDGETPPPEVYTDNQTPQAEPPGQMHTASRTRGVSNTIHKHDVSPVPDDQHRDGPTLPASTYGESRPSNVSSSNDDDDSERGFLPMTFDPTPIQAPPQSSAPIPRKQIPRASEEFSPPTTQKENQPPRDYFGTNGRLSAKPSSREPSQEQRPGTTASSRSVSTEREPDRDRSASQSKPSPHILYQDKGRNRKRDTSGSNTPVNGSATASPVGTVPPERTTAKPQPHPLATDQKSLSSQANPQDGFRLGDVPTSKRADSRKNPRTDSLSSAVVLPADRSSRESEPSKPVSPISVASQNSGINPFDDPKRKDAPVPGTTPVPPRHADRGLPLRGDSLSAVAAKSKQSTAEPPTPTKTAVQAPSSHTRDISTSSVPGSFVDAQITLSRDPSRSKPEPPPRASFDVVPPPRSATRPSAPSKSVANDDFIAPRHAPPPPAASERHRHNDSISTLQSEDRDLQLSPALRSAGLPKYSLDGGFSMDDEMGRILRGELGQGGSSSPSMLRRVSNAVKHGRSFSDRAVTQGAPLPRNGSLSTSIATPSITSPSGLEGFDSVHASLRRAQLHIAELETEKLKLQEKLNSSGDIKAVNTELREKRSTMAFLDTQREMVVRELEIMTDHLSKAKDPTQPLDLTVLKTNILRDFGDSLQKLKDSMGGQIEDLMHKRNELTDEIGNLIQMKDKGFQEYESLSTKNAQLASHNNELIRSIQSMYQDNRAPNGTAAASGLGIYNGNVKDATSAEVRNLNPVITDTSMPNLLQDPDAEPASILTTPQVVNIRKGAQPKKFNWRRGGEKVAGKVTKGIKGAFVGNEPNGRGQYTIGMPYNQSQNGQAMVGSDQSSIHSKQTLGDEKGYNFFNSKNGNSKAELQMKNNSGANLASVDGSVLFGSELTARCEHENRVVPVIVSTCINEVEKRGIDVEGIYRKSGGAGQVKQVQQGFEKDSAFDISDDDLDIHAVTSTLKQYFRKLPTPLITYDVYDSLLEAGQAQDKEKLVAALRFAIESLPDAHRDCLGYLFQHLAKVVTYESKNLMTPLNLAVVFAPTIMRPLSIEREMSDMQVQRQAVQALLENHKSVFVEE